MLEITTLLGQSDPAKQAAQIARVARQLAGFITAATQSLHVAIYDFRLSGDAATAVIDALNERAASGVVVRVAYFEPRKARQTTEAFSAIGADPAPGPDPKFLARLGDKVLRKGIAEIGPKVAKEAVDGMGHLMHDKYIVRDGMTPAAALWTGSTNFTDDAFSLQDNNIVVLASQDLCEFYETDFGEMWSQASITSTGKNDTGHAVVDGAGITVSFSPGDGRSIDHEIASRIAAAHAEIRIACMVISSAGILGALVDALDRGVRVSGIYDGTEMEGVEKDWANSSASSRTKLPVWTNVKSHLVAKWSHPYTATGPHDFMHNKLAVIDDGAAITGSFNFSNNATRNAENVLVIESGAAATQYARYVDALVKTYRGSRKPYSADEVSDRAAAVAFAAREPAAF